MSDIKLFRTDSGRVEEVAPETPAVERSLQQHIEEHLREFLDVCFLASEYSTGKAHGGRIDTLAIDQMGCPVIIEYKRAQNANVINQGLFYMDWLLDHKADFAALVADQLVPDVVRSIDWSSPRLICIAGSFTKYDEHAVRLISRNVELIRYRKHGELLLLERVNQIVARVVKASAATETGKPVSQTFDELLSSSPPELRLQFERLREFALSLGPGIWEKQRKYAVDFRLGTAKEWENFATVHVNADGTLAIWIDDVHDTEVASMTDSDLESLTPLIRRAYETVAKRI